MIRIMTLLLGLTTLACQTTKEWHEGPIPGAEGLSASQKMTVFSRFALERVDSERVYIREQAELVPYTIDSYKPIFDSLDRTLYPKLSGVKREQNYMILAAAISGGAVGYASGTNRAIGQRYAAAGIAVLAAIASRYFGREVDTVVSGVRLDFNLLLENHLFRGR